MLSLSIRLALALAICGGAACTKPKQPVAVSTAGARDTPRPAGTRTTPEPGTATITPVGPVAEDAPEFGAIYFDFDATTLSADARIALDRLGGWLVAHPTRVRIEGHADDRGTTEYNIALGQRRAQVIVEYLERLGVEAGQLDTISYGEERPAVEGEDESAWARNRRGEVRPR